MTDTIVFNATPFEPPRLTIAQLDGFRDLLRYGMSHLIPAAPDGADQPIVTALSDLVAHHLIGALVAHRHRELRDFFNGTGPKFAFEVGMNRVVGFLHLIDLAFNTKTFEMDEIDTFGDDFLAECYDGLEILMRALLDAFINHAPAALIEVLGSGQPVEVQAAVAATIANWDKGDGDPVPARDGLLRRPGS